MPPLPPLAERIGLTGQYIGIVAPDNQSPINDTAGVGRRGPFEGIIEEEVKDSSSST